MKFDIAVGNPPYGVKKKGSTSTLHLQIMKTVLDLCTDKLCFIMPSKPITQQLDKEGIWYKMFKNAVCIDIKIVKKGTFQNTKMDDTAIYYCDRKANPEDYCKKLDVDDRIYDAISDEGRLFIDKMSKFNPKTISFYYGSRKTIDEEIERVTEVLKDDKYYLNVNRAGIKPGEGISQWISSVLEKTGILTKDEEIDFCKEHTKKKVLLECPNKEYGENLKSLMINGLVLRYSLWLTQIDQAIYQAQYKYVPDIDYTEIDTDEKLLSKCGFTELEVEKVMTYLKDFDFTQNRNNIVRDFELKPDSSPSSSESTPKSYLERLKETYSNPSKKIQKRREELESEFAYDKEWGQTDYDDFWEWLAYEKFPEQDYSFLSNNEEDED